MIYFLLQQHSWKYIFEFMQLFNCLPRLSYMNALDQKECFPDVERSGKHPTFQTFLSAFQTWKGLESTLLSKLSLWKVWKVGCFPDLSTSGKHNVSLQGKGVSKERPFLWDSHTKGMDFQSQEFLSVSQCIIDLRSVR